MTWMICLFGGIGAMARYVLDVSIQRSWNRDGNHSFPLATLVINGVASLCAGIAMMSYYAQSVDMGTVMTFVVGFLGGFSTFSSAINEVLSLIRKRRFAMALGYGAATVAVPLACVALGFGIAMLGGRRIAVTGSAARNFTLLRAGHRVTFRKSERNRASCFLSYVVKTQERKKPMTAVTYLTRHRRPGNRHTLFDCRRSLDAFRTPSRHRVRSRFRRAGRR